MFEICEEKNYVLSSSSFDFTEALGIDGTKHLNDSDEKVDL